MLFMVLEFEAGEVRFVINDVVYFNIDPPKLFRRRPYRTAIGRWKLL